MTNSSRITSVGYLGDAFSYHHIAAMEYFGRDCIFSGFPSFDAVVEALQNGQVENALLAVQNTLAGDVPGNYGRIADGQQMVTGEIRLHIALQLAALPGVNMEEIRTVFSHPMAIRETRRFFALHPQIKLVETASTAGALKLVAESGIREQAAIGSKAAVKHYGLMRLGGPIDDHPDNITRFLILSAKKTAKETTTGPVIASLLLRSQLKENIIEHTLLPSEELLLERALASGNVYIEIAADQQLKIVERIRKMEETLGTITILGVYSPGITVSV